MIRRRSTSYLVGSATVLLILISCAMLVGVGVFMLAVMDGRPPRPDPEGLPPVMVYLFLGNVVVMLIGVALLVAYLIDVYRNPAIRDAEDKRIMWTILIVFLGAWAMAVYWWLYLRPGSASFALRLDPGAPTASSSTASAVQPSQSSAR